MWYQVPERPTHAVERNVRVISVGLEVEGLDVGNVDGWEELGYLHVIEPSENQLLV